MTAESWAVTALKIIPTMLLDPANAWRKLASLSTRALLVPLLMVTVGTTCLLLFYYQQVNIGWLRDNMAATASPSQRDVLRNLMTRNTLFAIGAISVCVTVPLFHAIYGLYFFLVAKVTDLPFGFGKWFAFSVWSSVPNLLLIPAGVAAILLTANGQLATEQLNPTSFNSLVFHFPQGHAWKTLLDSMSIMSLWSSVLMVIGLRVWTGVAPTRSIVLVLVPNAILYIPWILVIMASRAAS